MWVRLWLAGGTNYRRRGAIDRDDSGGQQDDDEDNDDDDHYDEHDQLDVLPPVGASHFLRRLLEVLSLSREQDDRDVDTEIHTAVFFNLVMDMPCTCTLTQTEIAWTLSCEPPGSIVVYCCCLSLLSFWTSEIHT